MSVYIKMKKRFYQDSLKLMRISSEIKGMEGIKQAFAFMATEINKRTRIKPEFMSKEVNDAGPDDLIMFVESEDEGLAEIALEAFESKLMKDTKLDDEDDETEAIAKTFDEAIPLLPANLAVISVPGVYATPLALNALSQGMNVHLFSDNVPIEDEVIMKDYARERGLIVMGPDCGTSIISGIPICFANKIRKGNVGLIGASGTGLQELSTLIDSAGYGITHAIGTGGRDLSSEINAKSTLIAISLLGNDPETEIIALVSKPPSKTAEEFVIKTIEESGKPAVLAFLGSKSEKVSSKIFIANTIEEAAAKTIALCKKENPTEETVIYERKPISSSLFAEIKALDKEQKIVRGLYTGGTLASEAQFILQEHGHHIIDLGDDEYTRGNLHPMIDPSSRGIHIKDALSDPKTAVLLCDVVLGYGSHKDPAGVLSKDIIKAQEETKSKAIVIASVIGTDNDPQKKQIQTKKLEEAEIWVYPTNQFAAEIAKRIAEILQNNRGMKTNE